MVAEVGPRLDAIAATGSYALSGVLDEELALLAVVRLAENAAKFVRAAS